MANTLFVVLWFVGIAISLVFMNMNPARNDLGPKTQRARRAAIVWGFVPCSFLATIIQVVYIIVYRASIGASAAGQARLNAQLSTDLGSPRSQSALPSDGPALPRSSSSDNPFI